MLKPYKRAEIRFEQLREIGADGRNSTTHVVNDIQLGAEIVIKTISKTKLKSPAEYFSEARHLYSTSHQNVVQIHYACEDADNIYIAMPLYSRGSVKSLMAVQHLTVREIVRLACQVLSGLHNIHSKGLIHFDIKPDNILLSDRGEALLSDFGLAKQMNLGVAQPNGFYIRMAPPEVTAGPPYDLRFDIYQIGLTLYRMINGNAEFQRQFSRFLDASGRVDRVSLGAEITSGTFPDRSRFAEHVPARLKSIVTKCLEINPSNRFQSALALANALAEVDQCLDWRYSENAGTRMWTKNEGGTEILFSVAPSGVTNFTTAKNGGAPRRTKEHCKSSMTSAAIKKVLRAK